MEKWEAAYIAGIIDGEGTITLTRMHQKEHRRPCISIASNEKDLLLYLQNLTGGSIYSKKNYNINKHQNSYTLYIKKKKEVFKLLEEVNIFLRIEQKKKRANWILNNYDHVTPRNGKYSEKSLQSKLLFEEKFFLLSYTYKNKHKKTTNICIGGDGGTCLSMLSLMALTIS